jgi:hydrogenase-4 component F
VEHVGLLVLGLGLGGVGAYGSVLHLVNNALAKGLLFLAAGNVALTAGSERGGLLRTIPASGFLLLIGLFAVTGSPPFGMFLSELTILRAAWGNGHPWIAAVTLVLLALIFIGIAVTILELLYGPGRSGARRVRESWWLIAGPAALALAALVLGVSIPGPLQDLLARASTALGGAVP